MSGWLNIEGGGYLFRYSVANGSVLYSYSMALVASVAYCKFKGMQICMCKRLVQFLVREICFPNQSTRICSVHEIQK